MKSALLLVNCVLLYNAFFSEAEVKFNKQSQPVSPTGPSVHAPLVISITPSPGVAFDLIPSLPLEQVCVFEEDRKYLFTCPAENQKSTKLTADYSRTGYGLFIRTIYKTTEKEQATNEKEMKQAIEETKCSKPLIPLFVHLGETSRENIKYTTHATGFEVYIDANMGRVAKADPKSSYLELQNEFQWYDVINISFDPTTLDVKEVKYQMNTYDFEPIYVFTDFVQNYDLGKRELFGSVDIAELYTIDNQEAVFNDIFENQLDLMQYFSVAEKKYLVQLHLAPLEVFPIPHLEEAARTYGNLAPVWRVIKENAWKKIEEFLQRVVYAVGPIDIISGTYGTLSIASENIFLGDNQVTVPLSFYKIVIFKKAYQESVAMLIETINNPYKKVEKVLCAENYCQQYGWDALENKDYTTGRTICCPVTQRHIDLFDLRTIVGENDVFDLRTIEALSEPGSSISVYDYIAQSRTLPKQAGRNPYRWSTIYENPRFARLTSNY